MQSRFVKKKIMNDVDAVDDDDYNHDHDHDSDLDDDDDNANRMMKI